MKIKNRRPEFIKELNENHQIAGEARIGAEWNWNNTSKLMDPARRGSKIRVYNGAGINANNPTDFAKVFDEENYIKAVNHYTVNWTNEINTPHLDWETPGSWDWIPVKTIQFGAEQLFYLDIEEAGTYRFGIDSDDSHEFWIYDLDDDNPTLVTSFYGGRKMSNTFTEQANYTFADPGRYLVRLCLTNIDLWWGITLGIQTPEMRASGEAMKEIPSEMTIHYDHKNDPSSNPEIVDFVKNENTEEWEAWREYYPVKSITDPRRPTSGINYNELTDENDSAFIMSHSDFAQGGKHKNKRYYLLSKTDELKYRYWKTDEKSDGSGNLNNSTVRITYTEPVQTNKIRLTFNLGPKPTSLSIRYLDEDDQWVEIYGDQLIPEINDETGQLDLYRSSDENWYVQHSTMDEWKIFKEDYSVPVKAIEFTIHSINQVGKRAEVIEFSARKHLDITDRVLDFDIQNKMDEADWMRILGKISANTGKIEISNWDNAFQLDESLDHEHRLKQVAERSTEFTFDVLYDLSRQGITEKHPVRVGTFWSAEWSRDGEFDYTVQLFDSAKHLQNKTCPDIYEKHTPVHVIVSQILDGVGFTDYDLDREDFSISAPVLDYFANESGGTVWDALSEISESLMCAIFFDEFGKLQIMSKEEITRYPETADYTLYGEDDVDDPTIVPNILSLEKSSEVEANSVTVNWTPRAVKSTKSNADMAVDFQYLTDILWQSQEGVTLRAVKLVKPMTYGEERFFWIDPEKAKDWLWSGKANVNGEIIEWDGKEYSWLDSRTGKTHTEILYSHEDKIKRDMKAQTGTVAFSVNKFTGKIALKRDEKTGEPIGRGRDQSKYRISHYTKARPGWNPYRFTVGNPGFQAGYWPGEEATSFYQVTDKDSPASAIGINRPTNRNDDWFKTQTIVRSASSSAKLQQWGFRFRFLESTTIGELSLMFNMGAAIGNNSENVTTAGGPATFNQMYHLTLLETQNIVRNATHEIGAWVQTPDPVYRTWDNAIRGSASRMYTRNHWDSWEERMKGIRYNFERNKWYDIKVDLTRGRGYRGNESMHFHVWVNGVPVGGFDAAGPPNRHKFLAPTNYWAIGSRAASKIEISNAYHWTEFTDPEHDSESYMYDFRTGGYLGTYLEEGILYEAKGASKPFRDGAGMHGEFFFDDMGSTLHEIREYEVDLEKTPAESIKVKSTNQVVRPLEIKYGPNSAKFSVVNVSEDTAIAQGEEALEGDAKVDHSLLLYGYTLFEEEDRSLTKKDEKAIKDRGEVKLELDAKWVNDESQAEELGKWILRHFSEPKDVLTIDVFGDASFSIGDKINIYYENGEIDPEWLYIVSRLDIRYSANSGLNVELEARRVRNNPIDEGEYDSIILPPAAIEPDKKTITVGPVSGKNTSTWRKGRVDGTDLLIPFLLENGSVGYLGGDSFSGPMPGSADWRSPVAFRSNYDPKSGLIVFDSAYRTPGNAEGNHLAPEIIPNSHVAFDHNPFGVEYTVIPNDGYSFSQTGRQIVSYQSVNRWRKDNGNMSGVPGAWRTNYTALAFTDNGNDFEKWPVFPGNAFWLNNIQNSSPFQMQSWQDGGDGYMYMISVKAGRQTTPMMLQRVPWELTFWKPFYQGRKLKSGSWTWTGPDQCDSIIEEKVMGEPSLRKLQDGKWAMSYWTNTVPEIDGGPYAIVTRSADHPTGPWSEEKVQITHAEVPNLYGGFIHPYSDTSEYGLVLMVSQWTGDKYHVLQVRATL